MPLLATKNDTNHSCSLSTGQVKHEGGDPIEGSTRCFAGKAAILRQGDQLFCKAAPLLPVIVNGSSSLMIEGRPAACQGSKTSHGSTLSGGCERVIIGR